MRSSRGRRSPFTGSMLTREPVHQSCLRPKQEQARSAAPTLCGYFGSIRMTAGNWPLGKVFFIVVFRCQAI